MSDTNTQVQTKADEYLMYAPDWELVDNIVKGKAKEYLRDVKVLETDPSRGDERQKEYDNGAYLLNFTASTLAKMVGGVFRNEPSQDLGGSVEYLLTNANGYGNDINQLAQRALNGVLAHGRAGVFVDAPPKPSDSSRADDVAGKYDPRMKLYPASSIINWTDDEQNLVVLKEQYNYTNTENEFKPYTGNQYRVLDIHEGVYRQRLYKFKECGGLNGDMQEFYPKADGELMTEVPFSFIGSNDNMPSIDPSPIFPIADLNRVVYRNTADNEEQLFVMGQVMLIVSPDKGTKKKDWDELNPNGIKYGSRSGLLIPNGSAELLQAEANGALPKAIQEKIEQAVALGAEIITPTAVITAESARLQKGGEVSMITNAANNVSNAFESAIKWCQLFKGDKTATYSYELNTDFFMTMLTAADRKAWLDDIAGGVVTKNAYRDRLRKSGEIDSETTNKQLEAQVETTIV